MRYTIGPTTREMLLPRISLLGVVIKKGFFKLKGD